MPKTRKCLQILSFCDIVVSEAISVTDYVAYKRTNEQWNMKRYHFHEQYELLLSLSENAQMFVTDRSYPLKYGSLIVLPSAVLHRSVGAPQQLYNRYVIRFPRSYVDSLSTQATNLLHCFQTGRVYYLLTDEQTKRLSALYDRCMVEHHGFGADLRKNIAFVNLLLEVNEIAAAQSDETLESQDLQSNIAEILAYIPEHLTDDLSLDTLASQFFISKSHLCRLFKDSTGFSPGEFIIKSRVMHARSLLREGKSVQEACDQSGFRNYTHFIRTFRQNVGVSPGKYKSQEASGRTQTN